MDNFHLRPGSLHAWHWSGYITIDSPPELEGPYGGAQGTTTQPATIVVSVPMDGSQPPLSEITNTGTKQVTCLVTPEKLVSVL